MKTPLEPFAPIDSVKINRADCHQCRGPLIHVRAHLEQKGGGVRVAGTCPRHGRHEFTTTMAAVIQGNLSAVEDTMSGLMGKEEK